MGQNAKEVELELINKINMPPLKYSCCVWENGMVDAINNKNKYIVKIISGETFVDHRDEWKNIGFFYVIVFLLLENP